MTYDRRRFDSVVCSITIPSINIFAHETPAFVLQSSHYGAAGTNQAKTNQSSIWMKSFGLLGVFVGSQDFDLATASDRVGVVEIATNYRYIVKTEGIRDGNAPLEGTRIGVDDIVGGLHIAE